VTRPLSILYVDDDADIRHIVQLALKLDPAIRLRCAASAEEALHLLAGDWRPDAAMLDMMMPGIDGLALLRQIREREGAGALPAIFVTARSRPADLAAYREAGVMGVISKPFDPMRLAGEVRAMLGTALDRDA
jgi:two-component system, OmpR family, response regulator